MIADILLSCLNLYSKHLPITELVTSDAVSEFLHPCEKETLEKIIDIINSLRKIAKFAKIHSSFGKSLYDTLIEDAGDPLPEGLYLKAFANALDNVLKEYYLDIAELEKTYFKNPSLSLLFIYEKLLLYKPLAAHLNKLIRRIRMQNLRGCGIFQYIYANSQHGDIRVDKAMKSILTELKSVFLKQLSHWMLYAQLTDPYSEFFIQYCEDNILASDIEKNPANMSSKCSTTSSIVDGETIYADIWRHEINYEMLPNFLSATWAEKVLFVGQTVLMFHVNANTSAKVWQNWYKTENKLLDEKQTLWNKQEEKFFTKIQSLLDVNEIFVSNYDRVVDEIKSYVTARLSEIAINQADLLQQLRLIKDYYLMGRGELYLEFIRQIYSIKNSDDNENKLRRYIKAFELAAYGQRVGEEEERFTLDIAKPFLTVEGVNAFTFLQYVQLQYKINWPLHLLFSPKVIERYNVVFRFLLFIKRMQYELHMIWRKQTHEVKECRNIGRYVLSMRNQLMFFIDNLQYYIQVDVLESQFSILMNSVNTMASFDQIQKAHSIFQANILSLCFLLTEEDDKMNSVNQSVLNANNPVHIIFDNIFHICEDFCSLIENFTEGGTLELKSEIIEMDKNFMIQVENLMKLAANLEKQSKNTPLTQLVLRLDFNRWFSEKSIREQLLAEA